MRDVVEFYLYDCIDVDDDYDYWAEYEDDPIVQKAKRDSGFVCPHCKAVLRCGHPCPHQMFVYGTMNAEFVLLKDAFKRYLDRLIASGAVVSWDMSDLTKYLLDNDDDIAVFEDVLDSHRHCYASVIFGICGVRAKARIAAG